MWGWFGLWGEFDDIGFPARRHVRQLLLSGRDAALEALLPVPAMHENEVHPLSDEPK